MGGTAGYAVTCDPSPRGDGLSGNGKGKLQQSAMRKEGLEKENML